MFSLPSDPLLLNTGQPVPSHIHQGYRGLYRGVVGAVHVQRGDQRGGGPDYPPRPRRQEPGHQGPPRCPCPGQRAGRPAQTPADKEGEDKA